MDNLYVRKRYGKDKLRLLRCRHCKMEFGERRNTPLLNCKLPKAKAALVAEALAEGNSAKGTARVVKVSPEAVRRLGGQLFICKVNSNVHSVSCGALHSTPHLVVSSCSLCAMPALAPLA
ncbi:MAG: hypothetical protein M3511_10060 [Deinococcota bacterium]|nr:hypothetical protein [Deinococcota bacterium]